ncbi:hypothetical protein B0T16DRAFT_450780 [Cercophora newfieldiana]|uniref:Uncharacterized protein n=1 Tax=Cercophora newfieldiana TaxID=92897 RepID=A0AA39YM21_9PEZI|nr:hypothetical protein B0T16DRAFT_450780 [Cercophora newfieldiana]
MCNFTQREYSCGHYRWIASQWCREYTLTHKRCQPDVTDWEYKAEVICGECKAKARALHGPYVAWEGMIKRSPLIERLLAL